MSPSQHEAWEQANEVEVRDLVFALWSRRLWIVAFAAVGAIGFGIYAFLATPYYKASTVLVSASSERSTLSSTLTSALGSLGGLASLAGLSVPSSNAETEEALAVLSSRQFTESFLRDYDLRKELYPELWDPAKKTWAVPADEVPSYPKAVIRFNEKIRTITRDKKTGLITMSIVWRDRKQAAEWANILVTRLNAEMRGRAIRQAEASLGFLEKELAGTMQLETREAINRLVEAQVRQRMLANVTQEYVFRVVDPATTPDFIDKVRPRKIQLIILGGMLCGALAALWFIAGVLLGSPSKKP
jgi:uncharacterized protein involved in exopolysaccharide biosynthesis